MDFEKCRAIIIDDGRYEISLTTVQDMAIVVAEALGYEGEWPTTGGFEGSRMTMAELLHLGERLRGTLQQSQRHFGSWSSTIVGSNWHRPFHIRSGQPRTPARRKIRMLVGSDLKPSYHSTRGGAGDVQGSYSYVASRCSKRRMVRIR